MALFQRFAFTHRHHEHLLIACFPKSGSTYLSKVLREMAGLAKAYVSEPGPQNEQDLSATKLAAIRRRSVLQQHVKATRTNVELLLEHRMRPIVQTRNLFDVIVSLHDHFERDHRSLPCGYISQEYLRAGWDERVEYLIYLHLPWYFNFVLSWREAGSQLATYPLSYEQLFADQPGELARIAAFYNLAVTAAEVSAAIGRALKSDTRLNVGVTGRGREMLTPRHKQSIRQLAAISHITVDEAGNIASHDTRQSRAA